MRTRQIIAAVFTTLGLASSALADDQNTFTLTPSYGFQYKQLEFKEHQGAGTPYDMAFRADLPMIDLGLNAAWRRVYLAVKYDKSLRDTPTSTSETNTGNGWLFMQPGQSMKVGREDKSITLGVNVWDHLNLFGGFMSGKTTLTIPPVSTAKVSSPACGTPGAATNLAWMRELWAVSLGGYAIPTYEQEYTERGPFAGLRYGWQIRDAGMLSASAAFAHMQGNYHDNLDVPATPNFNYNGSSSGTSLGLTWTSPLNDNSSYFIDLRRQEYRMDGDNSYRTSANKHVQTDETMTGLTIGLNYYY